MHPFFQDLEKGSRKLGLNLSEDVLGLLLKYQDALVLWNKAYNLTAIRDPKEMLVKHLLDSLSILKDLPQGRLLDIGTGGGMPGMIIALCQPERQCVLLDSNGKKIRFLKQFIADLKLQNVIAVQTRVEDQDSIQELGQFDVITSRAFASLTDFVKASAPYMHEKSIIASMKGLVPNDEIAQLKNDFSCEIIELHVPRLDEQRHLLLLKQI
ncbi:16S rRNA (guanine(527)-N(7))-methyltransferase RsmG [Acinetobacter gerneri]|jgi:16S rRNA (guanine527-N7)-methyltransferase|uniref:Ribosomal RNA small subunit methyltransferase G n=1 Tax=Acinetobacter gerneri DSM 14967 = CIP 107464 = MTCC 9824 TaxID=1120926 RepID=N8YBP3_9GAMM|nr:16S rRNA (guanine(527)-N(7))-methyltransferase RsmG [Acinetobacter gerneri]ENV34192.1 ribosomal RNA small subunit methyltransferase G [Acinetobacter gerneri DSM 14967 = CIP 107464 = MTCC 9824]EPR84625.1 rRNA small subunit methyltransferase, glucose inhibited division protein GidB [Acinetobacter gerneri DSM 14967 = CIP 107464 = MTCC 9824]MCH4245132.1 16S rRNA (guanine(527)-N(7))-methyltransferase RsmG [Acinetobacter gerneri]MDV2440458.1 16S rRNA (guanine(527)-N(7))-methyltransferase RsmG [Aci